MSRRKPRRFRPRPNPLAWSIRHLQMSLSSLGRLWRAPLATLMTAAVLGIALALPAGLHLIIDNVRNLAGGWEGTSSISLFLDRSLTDQQAERVRHLVSQRAEVADARLITKSQAMEEFRSFSGFGGALDLLDENPLPAVVLVRPRAAAASPEATALLARQLEGFREIELAQVDLQWVRRLEALTQTLERGVGVLAGLLSAAVLLIIGNTIRLEIQNRQSEIEIFKLVGGTDAFIRRPFLYEGIWYGLFGAVIATFLVLTSLYLMEGPVQRLIGLYQTRFDMALFTSGTFLAIFIGSPLLGLCGAWLAVGRHLRRIVPE